MPETLAATGAMPTQSDCDDFAKRTLQTADIQPVENQALPSTLLSVQVK